MPKGVWRDRRAAAREMKGKKLMGAQIIKINEHTYRIEDSFVRYFLLEGTERALLLDSGATSPDAKKIASSLTALPLSLLNTHGDGDHTAGNAAFETFMMHRADWDRMRIGERFPGCALQPVEDGQVIDLGDRPLRIIAIPGHTLGSVAMLDVRGRALFTGDSVQSGAIFMFGEHRDPSAFQSSLEKLLSFRAEYDTVYPSHGEAALPGDYVQKVLNAWRMVLDGSITPREETMHGQTMHRYQAADCGFLCQ